MIVESKHHCRLSRVRCCSWFKEYLSRKRRANRPTRDERHHCSSRLLFGNDCVHFTAMEPGAWGIKAVIRVLELHSRGLLPPHSQSTGHLSHSVRSGSQTGKSAGAGCQRPTTCIKPRCHRGFLRRTRIRRLNLYVHTVCEGLTGSTRFLR